jgi:heme oxygenase (mycobilin-producing)
MYQVNNKIPIESEDHLRILKERFSGATARMKAVPGFISFRLLKAEDGSHVVAETIFESKEHFIQWTESDHFKQAHGGRGGSSERRRAHVDAFEILIN